MNPLLVWVTSPGSAPGDLRRAFQRRTGFPPTAVLETEGRCIILSLGDDASMGRDATGLVSTITLGDVLDAGAEPASELARRYVDVGVGFGRDVYGCWASIVVDAREDRVLAVTDRLGSRRLFHRMEGGSHWISSSLAALPTERLALDRIGIAWYLSNGAVHCGRTLFEGVSILSGAAIHELTGSGVKPREYWSLPFVPERVCDQREIGADLLEHLRAGVRRCTSGADDIWMSLSGGYDSPGMGAMLREQGSTNVQTFTYAHGTPEPGWDAWVAREMARILGFGHRIVDSYHGDLTSHIEDNARFGEGVVHPCDEVDAWSRIRPDVDRSGRPVLLVGDHCIVDAPERRAVRKATEPPGRLQPFSRLGWLSACLGAEMVRAGEEGMSADVAAVIARADPPEMRHSYAFIKQRVPNVVMPWRHAFAGRHFMVRSPMLDNDVIDFLGTIPANARQGDFYHDAMQAAYPDVYAGPRATIAGYYIGLRNEVSRQGADCVALMGSRESRLDEVLPAGLGDWILGRILRDRSVVGVVKRRLRGLVKGLASQAEGIGVASQVRDHVVFRRYMILREALTLT